VLSVRDPQTGKRKVKFIALPDAKGRREAQRECARIITQMASDAHVEPGKVTVAQFLERWLDHIKTQVAASTHERYGEFVRNNIVPALGAVRLTKLRPEHLSAAYSKALTEGRHDGRDGGLAPQTVKHMHTILKQALKQACIWRTITNNPADLVKPPKVSRKEMHTVDTDATARMIEAARGSPIFSRDRAAASSDRTGAEAAKAWCPTNRRPSRPYQRRRHTGLAGLANPQL
jgi:site-specific recombinase XerC